MKSIKRKSCIQTLTGLFLVMALFMTGCSGAPSNPQSGGGDDPVPTASSPANSETEESKGGSSADDIINLDISEIVPPVGGAIPTDLDTEPSGELAAEKDKAVIDYSHTEDGYVMVKFKEATDIAIKSQVAGPTTTYTYNLVPEQWTAFPLSDGNGTYKVSVFENIEGTKYSVVMSQEIEVNMTDEFAPFLRPNQYVNWGEAPKTVAVAAKLCEGTSTVLEKVSNVYLFVTNRMTYDEELAKNVQSGYLPDLDKDLESGKGICFDYAAMMTGMLRSQYIPCKLVVGYVGEAYHAWISVWSEKEGWIDSVIYFDGNKWQLMDPTYASTGANKYVGDGKNYTAKYFY